MTVSFSKILLAIATVLFGVLFVLAAFVPGASSPVVAAMLPLGLCCFAGAFLVG